MKKILLSLGVALIGVALVIPEADARRLGGSRSIGQQRNMTDVRPAQPPARQAQTPAPQQGAAAPAAGGAPQGAAAAAGGSKWMPILGGLAIGGLLGAMFGGSGLGSALLLALLALGAVFAIRAVMRARAQTAQPMQFAGAGQNTVMAAPPAPQATGFDVAASAAAASRLPAGFDADGFVRAAKLNFVRLQVANDIGNLEEIREFTTPEMFELLGRDVRERGGAAQQTDVVNLAAELAEVVTEGDTHWASVRFTGMVREAPGQSPSPFEEIWNLSKPADGSSGWLLAGIQQPV